MLTVLTVGVLIMAACGSSEAAAPAPTNTTVPSTPAVTEEPDAGAPVTDIEETNSKEPVASDEEPAPETEATSSEQVNTPEVEASGEQSAMATEETIEPGEQTVSQDMTTKEAPDIRTFVIVPEESQASYIVDEEFFGGTLDRFGIEPGLVDTIGTTPQVAGQMQLDLANLASPLISSDFQVNLQTLTSDQSRRDNAIRDRFLASNSFPLAEFTITSLDDVPETYIEGEEVNFKATGDITIREITQPATFDVSAKLEDGTITGLATTRLKMADFGFDPPSFANLFTVANDFTTQVEFTFKGTVV